MNSPRRKSPWADGEDLILVSLYPHEKTERIAELLGRSLPSLYNRANWFGLKKSAEFLATPASARTNGRQGIGYRFRKGQAAWNKGMKGLDIGGKATRFKPGHKPVNTWKPIGTERVNKDGIVEWKIADTGFKKNDWKPAHVIFWEMENGPVPPGHVVIFNDGNRRNFNIENLHCLSRSELMQRNTVHRLPEDLLKLCLLVGALNRQINKRSQK